MGKDVASALGYKNIADAIGKHVDIDDKLTSQIAIAGQRRDVIIINESGLYSLILSSKLPTAKQFKHWVTAFSSLAYTPALCVHIQSRIDSVCSGVETSTCQGKMDYRAKYEVNCACPG